MTSGSTGAPKAIMVSREQMAASTRLTGLALGLQAGERALVCLPTQYIAGRMMLVRGLELGLNLTVVRPSSNPLAILPTDSHFDFTAFVPMQLHHIIHEMPSQIAILNCMKTILVGGAEVSVALAEAMQAIHAPIYHTYGMTETVSHVALKRLNGDLADEYFRPLPEVTLGQDGRGCLTITSILSQHQTLITNDVVELRPDGSFRWLGRWDNVINSGGIKVQAEKVEQALARLLPNCRFFVGGLPQAELGHMVVAVIEGAPLAPEQVADLRAQLEQNLTKYEIPRQFYFLSQLRETPTGKIDRPANLAACR
jgi:O-succinylbenzoic acid--CoA ligase